jgi:DNA repair protein RadC
MLIKEMSAAQRPRERALAYGLPSLSDAEILALILQKGCGGESAVDVAHKLIGQYGLCGLSSLSFEELQQLRGVGLAKAMTLLASFELARRAAAGTLVGVVLDSPRAVAAYYGAKLRGVQQEHFYAVFVDVRQRVIGEKLLFVGTLDGAVVHPREVFKEAVKRSAFAIILVHNHPSGDTSMSKEDELMTRKMREIGELIGIAVLDHVVV